MLYRADQSALLSHSSTTTTYMNCSTTVLLVHIYVNVCVHSNLGARHVRMLYVAHHKYVTTTCIPLRSHSPHVWVGEFHPRPVCVVHALPCTAPHPPRPARGFKPPPRPSPAHCHSFSGLDEGNTFIDRRPWAWRGRAKGLGSVRGITHQLNIPISVPLDDTIFNTVMLWSVFPPHSS